MVSCPRRRRRSLGRRGGRSRRQAGAERRRRPPHGWNSGRTGTRRGLARWRTPPTHASRPRAACRRAHPTAAPLPLIQGSGVDAAERAAVTRPPPPPGQPAAATGAAAMALRRGRLHPTSMARPRGGGRGRPAPATTRNKNNRGGAARSATPPGGGGGGARRRRSQRLPLGRGWTAACSPRQVLRPAVGEEAVPRIVGNDRRQSGGGAGAPPGGPSNWWGDATKTATRGRQSRQRWCQRHVCRATLPSSRAARTTRSCKSPSH